MDQEQPKQDPMIALSGYAEGTVLPDGEVVRGDRDSAGNLIGWHKEPAAAGGSTNG